MPGFACYGTGYDRRDTMVSWAQHIDIEATGFLNPGFGFLRKSKRMILQQAPKPPLASGSLCFMFRVVCLSTYYS